MSGWPASPPGGRRLTLAIVLVLAVGGGLLALRLKPSTGIDTFVGQLVAELSGDGSTTSATSARTRS